MLVYTDGATSNNGFKGAIGGWAFIAVKDDEIVFSNDGTITEDPTNNICEMTAIIQACKFLQNKYPSEQHTILSDSAYIINCYMQKWYQKWQSNGWITAAKQPVKNKELWLQLIPFFESSLFDFQKVKAHHTNKFNNIADTLAVKARS